MVDKSIFPISHWGTREYNLNSRAGHIYATLVVVRFGVSVRDIYIYIYIYILNGRGAGLYQDNYAALAIGRADEAAAARRRRHVGGRCR